MPEVVALFLAGTATAVATGLGAVPVFLLGRRLQAIRPALWGLTIGLMTVASIVGLLAPALDQGPAYAVLAGFCVGIAVLVLTRRTLRGRDVHVGALHGAGVRTSALVFVVLLVHSLPEGFAIGTAWASATAGLGLYIVLAIGLQNVPEGTSVAIPMQAAGFRPSQQFWAAVLTSIPQPIGAVIAYVLVRQISGLLPASFAFAAGAMLTLVAVELVPQAFRRSTLWLAGLGTVVGAAIMLALSAALGV